MKLTKENIQEWKAELAKLAEPHYGKDYDKCLSDEDYLNNYEGMTPQEAIDEDLTCTGESE